MAGQGGAAAEGLRTVPVQHTHQGAHELAGHSYSTPTYGSTGGVPSLYIQLSRGVTRVAVYGTALPLPPPAAARWGLGTPRVRVSARPLDGPAVRGVSEDPE